MASIPTLPFNNEVKFTVVDEDIETPHGEYLILGWLRALIEKNPQAHISYLLFSGTKRSHQRQIKHLGLQENIKIHDYYTLNADEKKDWMKEELSSIVTRLSSSDRETIVILDCLSSLPMLVGVAKTCWFIEKLAANVSKVMCIYRRDFAPNNIPGIETLGTTYVRLETNQPNISSNNNKNVSYLAKITHQKPSGSLLQSTERVTQNLITCDVKSEKINNQVMKKTEANPEAVKTVQATFRIEKNQQEMEQCKKTTLPYILPATTSQITYEPDEADDADFDDPDDDLCF